MSFLTKSWGSKSLHRLNNSNLINRHNPLNRIARTNEFCNRRCIRRRSLGRKRIANIASAVANMDMMINLIIAQNIPDVFPVFFDNHSWDCLWKVIGTYPETNLYLSLGFIVLSNCEYLYLNVHTFIPLPEDFYDALQEPHTEPSKQHSVPLWISEIIQSISGTHRAMHGMFVMLTALLCWQPMLVVWEVSEFGNKFPTAIAKLIRKSNPVRGLTSIANGRSQACNHN